METSVDPRLEARYIVIKLKHLDELEKSDLRNYIDIMGIPTVDCVVVEADWPEYQPTVDAILARSK